MNKQIEKIFHENNLNLCIECGKCSSVCPMKDIFSEYSYNISPRGIINTFLFNFIILSEKDILKKEFIWYCMTCTVCKNQCPAEVDFPGFISALRKLLLEKNIKKHMVECERCEDRFISVFQFLYVEKSIEEDNLARVCPKCKRKLLSQKVKENLPGKFKI